MSCVPELSFNTFFFFEWPIDTEHFETVKEILGRLHWQFVVGSFLPDAEFYSVS